MALSKYSSLFQVNTRIWLTELSHSLRRPATLDDIPGAALDRLAETGFDWLWLLSVWQTGLRGQEVSRSNLESHGLYLDVPRWQCHAFSVMKVS